MKQRIIRVTVIVAAAAAVGTAGAVTFGRSQDRAADRPSPSPTVSATPAATGPGGPAAASRGGGPAPGHGVIEGPLAYPGEGIPGDIRICAVNLATARETCTENVVRNGRFKNGRGYRLSVPAGNYQVYAVVPSFDPGYQAFYSAFVVCGYRAECADHSPITVGVETGKTRTGIEPGDFYE